MDKTVNLLFLGDFVTLNPQDISLSCDLQNLISDSDFSVCNFEAPINGVGEAIPKSGPSLNQPIKSTVFLSNIGIDMVTLANNHIMDYGNEALYKTISSLENIIPVGAGNYTDIYKVTIVEIKKFKVGFLALTHSEFGILDDITKQDGIGCAWINHPCVNSLIIEAKKVIDYLFILSHAGVEDIDIPLPEWRFRYKELIDCGADGVIASHPHVPQGWEMHKEKPIFYSLGNFCFESNSKQKYWNVGLAAIIQIQHVEERPKLVISVKTIRFENNQIEVFENEETNLHLSNICGVLQNKQQYTLTVNKEVLSLWNKVYSFYFYYSISAITLKFGFENFLKTIYNVLLCRNKSLLLLNILKCESHRYAIIRALKLKNKIQ